jgi:hypothetical protein
MKVLSEKCSCQTSAREVAFANETAKEIGICPVCCFEVGLFNAEIIGVDCSQVSAN